MKKYALMFLLPLGLAACSLRSDVTVTPLYLVPGDLDRGSDLTDMWETGDYARAAQLAAQIDAKPKKTAQDLATLGRVELVCHRLDEARFHLRQALDLRPSHEEAALIAWHLSQVEYLAHNYGAAEEWASTAARGGLRIKDWHIQFLASLANVETHKISMLESSRTRMAFGRPEIPRIETAINGFDATAVIDSGAVLSIVSEELAERAGVRSLGDFRGEFYGLLGEPISVRFALLDSLKIGRIEMKNVPVAVMPNKSLHFFVSNGAKFKMDFLIGSNVLRNFRVELDFKNSGVTWTPLAARDRKPAQDQNMFFYDFRPLVHAAVNKHGWYLFVLDTGSEVTFLNDIAISTTRMRYTPRLHGATLQGLGGAQKTGQKLENIQIGVDGWAGDFRDIPLYGGESSRAIGIIGQNFMRNFRVVLDFGTMRMELHRDDATTDAF